MGDSALLEFKTEDWPAAHTLAQMDLWRPGQGTPAELLPLDLELRFDADEIHTDRGILVVSLRRADIEVVLENFNVVRGSRYGDVINEPYDIYELVDTAREQIEIEAETGGEVEVSFSPGFLGKLFAQFKRRRRKSKITESDRVGKLAVKQYRIIARNGNRWSVTEPRAPHLLRGRYLGTVQEGTSSRSEPLCFLSLRKAPASARVFVYAHPTDLQFSVRTGSSKVRLHRNKEVLTGIIAAKIISRDSLRSGGPKPLHGSRRFILCCSELTCEPTHDE